ncbi:MAG: hypothetical protein HY721_16325 [Planctomycetes bacterium]|nr:hypothetical protein [Planctomycetota bacterium]
MTPPVADRDRVRAELEAAGAAVLDAARAAARGLALAGEALEGLERERHARLRGEALRLSVPAHVLDNLKNLARKAAGLVPLLGGGSP